MGKDGILQISVYYQELDNTAKERYREKLSRIGSRDDPYVLEDRGMQTIDWAKSTLMSHF